MNKEGFINRPGDLILMGDDMPIGEAVAVDDSGWISYERHADEWAAAADMAEKWLHQADITGRHIDEIALLFGDEKHQRLWISHAVCDRRIDHFNGAWDRVHTFPFDTDYNVRYDWLRSKDQLFRLECMYISHGISPLHVKYVETMHRYGLSIPPIVHASFKCATETEYNSACEALAAEGAVMGQACRSGYGMFSYWRVGAESNPLEGVWVKPRLNTRDGSGS